MSPLKVLGRGYAIPRTEEGTVVRSRRDVSPGQALELRVADGSIHCRVEKQERGSRARLPEKTPGWTGDKEHVTWRKKS